MTVAAVSLKRGISKDLASGKKKTHRRALAAA